jgi:hypothetical protein
MLFYAEDNFATQKYILKLPDVFVISLCSFRMGRNKMPGVTHL